MEEKQHPYEIISSKDRDEWLLNRTHGIGGSDASAVLGINPYKSNVRLWEEKTGLARPEDISDKPYVQYGTQAEPLIRKLFALDYPEYDVTYHEHRILRSKTHPFMTASLDGELKDSDGRRGILEIKTSNILQSAQYEKWNEKIPQIYYAQVLHYLVVTGYEFVVLRAHLNSGYEMDRRTSVRHYFIERNEVLEDMDFLIREETRFWRAVESRKRPSLILPAL